MARAWWMTELPHMLDVARLTAPNVGSDDDVAEAAAVALELAQLLVDESHQRAARKTTQEGAHSA